MGRRRRLANIFHKGWAGQGGGSALFLLKEYAGRLLKNDRKVLDKNAIEKHKLLEKK